MLRFFQYQCVLPTADEGHKKRRIYYEMLIKNGAAFYDYSADALAEMFAAYLNPKVADLMKVAAKDAK